MKQIELQENKTEGELEWKTERKGSLGEQAVGNTFGSRWWFPKQPDFSGSASYRPNFAPCLKVSNGKTSSLERLTLPGVWNCVAFLFRPKMAGARLRCLRIESTQGYCDCVCVGVVTGWLEGLWESVWR